jgi:hypothetical protein
LNPRKQRAANHCKERSCKDENQIQEEDKGNEGSHIAFPIPFLA